MGKKSRKKGGGNLTKAARKEQLQERREQQLQGRDDCHEEENAMPPPREFFEGDRVWFREQSLWGDGTNPNNYRGYVKRVRENSLDIVPLQSKIDGTTNSVRVRRELCREQFIFPDFRDFTLRFDEGERVLCQGPGGKREPRVVHSLWPIEEIFLDDDPVPRGPGDSVPTYRCTDGASSVFAPDDKDGTVTRRPGCPLRLGPGDRVAFDARRARFGSEALRALRVVRSTPGGPWLEGTVVLADVPGREGYAAYECSVGKKFSCHILRDDDEHIARSDADPRERLLEAIEQQCSRSHLRYLAKTFQIDVSTFRDLAVQKSLQVASYQALLWLEYECGIEVLHIKDSDGNSILHKVAATPHAANFIRETRRMRKMDEKLDITDVRLMSSLNDRGETWLQVLVQRGDVKALDAALSPHVGFAWDLLYLPKDKRALLDGSIVESGNVVMKCIFDSFVSFRNLLQQYTDIQFSSIKKEDELLQRESMAVFMGDDALRHAKLLTRFISDWRGCSDSIRHNPLLHLVDRGSYKLFKLFFEVDENMFFEKDVYMTWSKEDRNEYIQPELAHQMEKFTSYDCIYVDILTACIIGAGGPTSSSTLDMWWRDLYLHNVRKHCISCDHNYCASWHAQLKGMIQRETSSSHQYKDYLEKRINALEDDENLQGRLKILEHLLNHDQNTKVDALEALRHRQCGVLRFLVGKDLLKLKANASSNREFKKRASELQFLDNGCIPNSMSTQSFLCFAAVQYDDLQSLQWLCDLSPLLKESCSGWNILHFGSFMGRVEIIGYLSTQPVWQSLVSEVCWRKPFQNAYALHIAVIQGHLHAAKLMLALKVPEADHKHKMPEYWAKKSKHKFVKEWGKEREKPIALERDMKKFLRLVDAPDTTSERLKEFIIESKCLDLEVWRGCDHNSFDEEGPLGYSMGDVVRKCCSNRSWDPDFVFWLLATKYFERDLSYESPFWQPKAKGGHDKSQHPVTEMNCNDLIAFTKHEGYGDIAGYLQKAFCLRITCVDPVTKHSLLKSAISECENGEFLLEIRSKLLRVILLDEIMSLSDQAIRDHLKRGCHPEVLDEVFQTGSAVKKTLIDEGYDSGFEEINSWLLKPTDMTTSTFIDYDDGHSLFKQLPFQGHSRHELGAPNIVLATEGFHQLLEYCLRHWGGWTAEMEAETARIAAFYGHSSIVDLFLSEDISFVSDVSDRAQAAINGAGEACRCRDVARLLARHGSVSDPIKDEKPPADESTHEDSDTYWKQIRTYMARSLMCSLLNGYIRDLYDSNIDDRKEMKLLKLIVNKLGYTHGEILHAIELLLNRGGLSREWTADVVVLLQAVTETLQLQPAMHSVQINSICGDVVKSFAYGGMFKEKGKESNPDAEMATERAVLSWIEKIAQSGVPIDSLRSSKNSRIFLFLQRPEMKLFTDEYEKIEQGQRQLWSQFDCVKNGQSLEEIQSAIEGGILDIDRRDRGGANLTHISAAYNRVDLLDWLVVTKKMDVLSKDSEGRTALEIAKAAKATGTTQWIMEFESKRTIAAFLKRNHHRITAMHKQKRLAKAASTIQKCFRGHSVRRLYYGLLLHRLEESHRFSAVWGNLIESLSDFKGGASNWSHVREKTLDIRHADFSYDDEYFKETDEQLSRALEGALQVHDEEVEMGHINNNEVLPAARKESCVGSEAKESKNASWLQFQMTSHVVKFLKRGDPKYKAFFVRRLQQLASGERSRILQKRLKGSDSTIYETYLEQKSGFRILWTEEGERIIIWFVAKHKEVSRLMKLIDDSKSRTARQHLPESLVAELQNDSLLPQAVRKEVLLDLFGNVPLKLYDFTFHSIDEIDTKSWTPRLHLTEEERDVVEAEGTVLVLGRSGTGKTVCICNRMEHDRQKHHLDQTFSQLFVARSKRLCRYVAEATCNQNSCRTFEELLHELDSSLPRLKNDDKLFFPSQRVDYQRFKQEFHGNSPKENKASALYVWTAIRTFIEGSVEAFQSPDGVLSRDDFIVVEKLGKNRCRIPTVALREGIYEEFLKYQTYKQRFGLWDDCDRIKHFLLRLEESKKTDPFAFDQVRRSKVYVDEIQDYTQIECLVFFYLGGPSGLFLAGDPAQSVVEGTEFRFEEIRSLGHFVAGNDRSLIPQKPKIINVNFRTHAGVLNCASAFLDLLFCHFPGSARQLRRDVGFFQGSRPGLLHKLDVKNLTTLLSDKLKGTVVLCHDESARHWQHALGGYQLVYGIREAKGLEFRHVILLDFFRELPAGLQKPWRDLILNRARVDFEKEHPLIGTHLKLLYTGITRCIERLFFVETSGSVAGDATVRWLTSIDSGKQATQRNALATRNSINDIELMAMTSDEFLSRGFDDAEVAELESVDLERALASLDRAVFCFEQANDSPLAAKARTHRRSIQLRIDLASRHNEMSKNDKTIAEMATAQLMESLVKEGLLLEVLNLFYAISPVVSSYAKGELERRFMSKIRLANENYIH